jgi:hypothetical protein
VVERIASPALWDAYDWVTGRRRPTNAEVEEKRIKDEAEMEKRQDEKFAALEKSRRTEEVEDFARRL